MATGNYYDDYENPEAVDRRAMLAQMGSKPLEQGGITGGKPVVDIRNNPAEPGGFAGVTEKTDAVPVAEDYKALGKYADRLGAWSGNTDKLGRGWDDKSERYKMLTVMSHFDPNAGITPEMIAALNGADIHGAKFSGDRDKLTVDNAGGWARFGKGGTGDVIERFNDPNNTNKQWGAWQVDDAPATGAPQGGGLPMPNLGSIAPVLGGDMGTYNTLQDRLRQILGGDAALNQQALLAQMG